MMNHIDFDLAGRRTKANKILSIIKEFKNLDGARILDIGVGSGMITSEIGKSCKWAYGIDVIDKRIVRENYSFLSASGTMLPFKSKSFDIVTCIRRYFNHLTFLVPISQ